MKLDTKGEDFLKMREAFVSKPYLCSAGIPTIGFGSTYYAGGTSVTMRDPPISLKEGTKLFLVTLEKYTTCVNNTIKVPMTQNEFNALVSLCYNIGTGAFSKSTLVRLMNSGASKLEVANQFLRWNKINGRTSRGLNNRRVLERSLFLGELNA